MPVIMAGGRGKRLWPLSRLGYPKQFQSLGGSRSPFLDSLIRLRSWVPGAAKPIIVTAQEHYHIVKQQLDSIGLEPLAVVLEPEARKTGPAITAAALVAQRLVPDAVLLVSPCDQIIRDSQQMARRIGAAAAAAVTGSLVVFGLEQGEDDGGACYLRTAADGRGDGLLPLLGFCTAARGDAAGGDAGGESGLLMNSGIYCFTAANLLGEAEALAPEMLEGCRRAVAAAEQTGNVFRLAARPFAAAPAASLGDAVLGRSHHAVVAPLALHWDDLGSWNTLWDLGHRDSSDNVKVGDAHVLDCQGVYARSEGPLTAVYGVDDLVVVATPDAVLVARRDDREGVAKIHNHLAACGREDVLAYRERREEWGWVETIEQRANYALRRIVVHPGCSMPVERHHQHGETLTVVSGLAHLWLDGDVTTLRETDSAAIPLRALHSIHNPGSRRLELIEIQNGDVTGDDDRIVLDDSWKERIKAPAGRRTAFADSEARALLSLGEPRGLLGGAGQAAPHGAGLGI
ncbi:MAG: mannose-1-phosphate guanylyltransferase/mannose-6-phosphate isomerase [Kiloniellaceae bacterium]